MTPQSTNAEPSPIDLCRIIERSGKLTDLIASTWQSTLLPHEPGSRAAEGLCALTIEHAASLQLLKAAG